MTEGYGETICPNCRCIEGSLNSKGNAEYHTGCYEIISCELVHAVVRVRMDEFTFEDVECPYSGESVTVPGFEGELNCPDSEILCDDVPCMNSCFGYGKCENGHC